MYEVKQTRVLPNKNTHLLDPESDAGYKDVVSRLLAALEPYVKTEQYLGHIINTSEDGLTVTVNSMWKSKHDRDAFMAEHGDLVQEFRTYQNSKESMRNIATTITRQDI